MTWDEGTIAKFPRLTDNSENAVTIRALACRAYENHYQFIGTWDDLNPQVDKVIGEFCVQEFGTDKWLEFSETQAELFEDQEQQSELPTQKKYRGKTSVH